MKYRLHSCSWLEPHWYSSPFLHDPFWLSSTTTCAGLSGPHRWTPSQKRVSSWMLCPSGQDDMCPFTITGEGRMVGRGIREDHWDATTFLLPCPLWCLLMARSRASTQWELLSLYHILPCSQLMLSKAATACSSKGFLLCPFFPPPWRSPARQYGHTTHFCTTAGLGADGLCFSRHHPKLAVHHDTCYPGYRRIFQNLQ